MTIDRRVYLEEDVGAHGLAVGDDWFLVLAPTVPEVQLYTPVTADSSDTWQLGHSLRYPNCVYGGNIGS